MLCVTIHVKTHCLGTQHRFTNYMYNFQRLLPEVTFTSMWKMTTLHKNSQSLENIAMFWAPWCPGEHITDAGCPGELVPRSSRRGRARGLAAPHTWTLDSTQSCLLRWCLQQSGRRNRHPGASQNRAGKVMGSKDQSRSARSHFNLQCLESNNISVRILQASLLQVSALFCQDGSAFGSLNETPWQLE